MITHNTGIPDVPEPMASSLLGAGLFGPGLPSRRRGMVFPFTF